MFKGMQISYHSSDPDELLAMVRDWQIEFTVIKSGGFLGEFAQLLYPDILFGRGTFSDGLRQQGMSPPGFRTFVIPLTPNFQLNWRGHLSSNRHLLLFPDNGELFSVSNLNFDVLTLSVLEKDLQDAAAAGGIAGFDPKLRQEAFVCGEGKLREFARELGAMAREGERLKQYACARLVSLMSERPPPVKGVKTAAGVQWVRDLETLTRCRPDTVIDLNQFCRERGISRRTLDYHLKYAVGLGPRQYLNRYRLNAVRRELRRAGPVPSIGQVARNWGFRHQGQFSTDYRNLFGETPSQTLTSRIPVKK